MAGLETWEQRAQNREAYIPKEQTGRRNTWPHQPLELSYTPTVCQMLSWIVYTHYLFQASEQPCKLGIISTLQIRSLSHGEVRPLG